jgi:hypothetical protein
MPCSAPLGHRRDYITFNGCEKCAAVWCGVIGGLAMGQICGSRNAARRRAYGDGNPADRNEPSAGRAPSPQHRRPYRTRGSIMRIEAKLNLGCINLGCIGVAPRSIYWNERRIDIMEIIDQWYGADYRYVKVKDNDGGLYILRFDERLNEWALIMFVSARGQVLATQNA